MAVHDGRGLGERAHGGLDRALQRGFVADATGQHRELEILVLVIVVCMFVIVIVTMVMVVIVAAADHAHARCDAVVLAAGPQQIVARRQLVDAAPLERILRLEESLVHGQRALQIEGADVEHLVDRRIGVLRAQDLRRAVDAADAPLDALQRGRVDQVGLVEQHHVGERDLLGGLVQLVDVLLEVLGVHHGDDGVELELVLELVVDEEGLRDRAGVGHAGGLDQDVVELVAALHEVAEDADQVAAHRAADAAVVHLEDLLLGADDELVSTPTSPNSFSMTAMRLPCFAVRMWFSSVVFPEPRKPVSTVTGTREGVTDMGEL